jgi:hypothetical protein
MFGKHWSTGVNFEETSDCTPAFYSNQGSRHTTYIWRGRTCTAPSGSNLTVATKDLSNSELFRVVKFHTAVFWILIPCL